jgi:hypothetical protein
VFKSDCYAFIRMQDANGYLNAISEDMRVFGVCIQRRVCRTEPAHVYRSLYVSILLAMSTLEVIDMLRYCTFDCLKVVTSTKTWYRTVSGNSYEFQYDASADEKR